MSAVVFGNVTKQYGEGSRPAVDRCSLTVEEGTFVVLLGPSGCGKTTLLKMVNRIIEPTSGHISVHGADVHTLPATELRRHIGYVIQQIGLFPHMTVEENVAVVPALLGWPKGRINERIDTLLELVGLPPGEYRRRRPSQLSGGQQQRVGIARAMAADPAILLMDEPFGAIDAITRTRLQDELLTIQQQIRKTVLFVTHDVEEALRLADVLVVMREGRIAQAAAPRAILARPADEFVATLVGASDTLRQLSLIPIADVMHPSRADGASAARDATTIRRDESLRTALSLMLQEDTQRLSVVDADGHAVGQVSLEDLQAALAHPRRAQAGAPVRR